MGCLLRTICGLFGTLWGISFGDLFLFFVVVAVFRILSVGYLFRTFRMFFYGAFTLTVVLPFMAAYKISLC